MANGEIRVVFYQAEYKIATWVFLTVYDAKSFIRNTIADGFINVPMCGFDSSIYIPSEDGYEMTDVTIVLGENSCFCIMKQKETNNV